MHVGGWTGVCGQVCVGVWTGVCGCVGEGGCVGGWVCVRVGGCVAHVSVWVVMGRVCASAK